MHWKWWVSIRNLFVDYFIYLFITNDTPGIILYSCSFDGKSIFQKKIINKLNILDVRKGSSTGGYDDAPTQPFLINT